MSPVLLFGVVIGLAILGFFVGRILAKRSVGGQEQKLHSRLNYYGWNVFILVFFPATLVLLFWLFVQSYVVSNVIASNFNPADIPEGGSETLLIDQVRDLAHGINQAVADGGLTASEAADPGTVEALEDRLSGAGVTIGAELTPALVNYAQSYNTVDRRYAWMRNIMVMFIAVIGFVVGLRRSHKEFRARNTVERTMLFLLIGAASVAVFTTLGIIYSMLSESINFFRLYSPLDFFFGLTWSPSFSGNSELGFLPVLYGTLYISLVALLVAIPVGLFAAIYLSEYAGPRLRGIAKPLLEVLAGIPTIVYGLFALTAFGPFLLEWFGPDGFGWMSDSRSVITAGVVMGILLIPFVSSLSDDIINAVPQSMRDASYGMGSTQSETIKLVILPAALPGIVGAILLAASRAIGETMIVVLGAGAIARFSANPFDAMTTITTRIVAQLTGDGNFESPETLVAFALGLTLFAMTLAMNIFALHIVRKYQEQYE